MSTFPYRIERTLNRASRATLKNGEIVIRLARSLTQKEEAEHIDVLLRRMTRAALQDAKRTHVDPFDALVTKKTDLLAVDTVLGPITLAVFEGPKTRAVPMDGGWRLQRSPTMSDASFRRFLWRLVSLGMLESVTKAVHSVNAQTFGVSVNTVTLKYMRSRWGSCSTKGTIALSTALLFTTPNVFRYVVIHELAHVLHMNHSTRFWRAVARFEPHYSLRTKQLRKYKLSR